MSKKLRLNLDAINSSLLKVEKRWDEIDDELDRLKIGRKDRFDSGLRERMLCAYQYLDCLVSEGIKPFSFQSFSEMLELNHLVHYGTNDRLRREYSGAMTAASEKFHKNLGVLHKWYSKHNEEKDSPLKIAAEIYVGIVGQPQLFIEGNHRTGSMISSWIDLYHGHPPFILSVDNAIAYFAPSSEIKHFSDKSTWRGRWKLPKYKKSFRKFWEAHVDKKYLLKD